MPSEKIGIVSHDAGGAEILASYVAQHSPDATFVLAGPALKVFRRRVGAVEVSSLGDALQQCDWLLCGTGWQSDWEWQAFRLGRVAGKRTVAFLDHWVNYRERFTRNGEEHLPNELWVGDAIAECRAREIFPTIPVTLVPNPFFGDLKRELAAMQQRPLSGQTGKRVLFICESISDSALKIYGDERYFGFTEDDAIRHFLHNLERLNEPVQSVAMRPHPSEAANKYDWVRQEFGSLIVRAGRKPLLAEIAESDIVVGCGSMAMVIAVLAGKRVICCIPPGGRPSQLPQLEIENWRY